MEIIKRTRIYLAVEGEGEQSFVKLLQEFANQRGLYVHLDCEVLGGGGYKTMLTKAVFCQQRVKRQKTNARASILLVDSDRSQKRDDGWSLEKLQQEAKLKKFHVCAQHPNQEGILFRMLPGNESKQIDAAVAQRALKKAWPDYKKPSDFYSLASKYELEDLLRVAKIDKDLNELLLLIGFNG